MDDAFGGLVDTVRSGQQIDEQIRAAYGSFVVEKLQQNLSPKVLHDNGIDGMNMSLEELLEKCMTEGETAEEMEPYYREMAQRVREAMDDPEGQVQQFLEALSLSDSAANRMLAMEYLGRGCLSMPDYGSVRKVMT